jgi:hypothetical protein
MSKKVRLKLKLFKKYIKKSVKDQLIRLEKTEIVDISSNSRCSLEEKT